MSISPIYPFNSNYPVYLFDYISGINILSLNYLYLKSDCFFFFEFQFLLFDELSFFELFLLLSHLWDINFQSLSDSFKIMITFIQLFISFFIGRVRELQFINFLSCVVFVFLLAVSQLKNLRFIRDPFGD